MASHGSNGSGVLVDFRQILATAELPALGPQKRPGVKTVAELHHAVETLATGARWPAVKRDLALAAALIWHDHLDDAHHLVQDAGSRDAAFLHGIVHRREPDYSNAQYWFHRVGRHAAFPEIAAQVTALPGDGGAAWKTKLVQGREWQPFGLIAACEEIAGTTAASSGQEFLRAVQRVEIEALADHILRAVE